MINLLDPNSKKNYKAARRNAIWLRYNLLLLASFIALNAILGLAGWFLHTKEQAQIRLREENMQSQTAEYKLNKQAIQNFRSNLQVAKTITDGQVSYSNVILNIAKTIPEPCRLETLSLNAQIFGAPQTLNFKCRSQNDVINLKSALEKNTQDFEKISIVSTTQSEGTSAYKTNVAMSATIKKPVTNNTPGVVTQ